MNDLYFRRLIRGAAWKIFTRIELDDNDMHPKQCTQNLFWFNGEATSGDFLCCSTPPRQRGIQAGLPIHPISRCITFFFHSRFAPSVPAKDLFPSKRKAPKSPRRFRPGPVREWDGMQKRVRDHVIGKNTAPEMSHWLLVTARTAENGERKDRAATQDAIQASNGALRLDALGN
jgi:hypothetical protein